MDKSFLVEDVTLRFPFPNNQLSQGLDAQGQPGAGLVDRQRADLVVSH